ncbi:hypothetical protein F4703DRAFT_1757851 [Phycomyces blakesleeanus]
MHAYTYDLNDNNSTWKQVIPRTNTFVPLYRTGFTATLAPNGQVYIFGGEELGKSVVNQLWSFDPVNLEYKDLTQTNLNYRSGHTATSLPNGQIVFISGLHVNAFMNDSAQLIRSNEVDIYDTNLNTWTSLNTTGEILRKRIGTSSALGPDNKTIFLFGDNGLTALNRIECNEVLLLDTTTWVWKKPNITGVYPTARSRASIGFIDKNLLAIAYGQTSFLSYKDLSILRIDDQETSKYSWLSGPNDLLNVDHTYPNLSRHMDGGIIAGIVIGSILLAIILAYCIWKSYRDLYFLPNLVWDFLWDPRNGEPLWTEICRLIIQCILAFQFLAYLGFSIQQAIESPITSITIRTKVSSVQVPDLRFCFDGWGVSEFSNREYHKGDLGVRISCKTDTGYACSNFITRLDRTVHLPAFEYTLESPDCYLFSPPSWFRLEDTIDGDNSGTKVRFMFNGDQSIAGTVRIAQYPPGVNPNVKVYNITTTDVPLIMSDQAVDEWAMRDMQGETDTNTFTIYTNETLSMEYQVKDHQYLDDNSWNQIGFLPCYNHTPEISTSALASDFLMAYNGFSSNYMGLFGSVTLYPTDYTTVIEQEQKIHTIINSLGSVGGILSLIISVQVWLFGFRPKSPWGIVQRWSNGPMRRSLDRNLTKNFETLYTAVPFVSNVDNNILTRSNSYDDETIKEKDRILPLLDQKERVLVLEKRFQLMERLLEAYYVDIEIFKELDSAISRLEPPLSPNLSPNLSDEDLSVTVTSMQSRTFSEYSL